MFLASYLIFVYIQLQFWQSQCWEKQKYFFVFPLRGKDYKGTRAAASTEWFFGSSESLTKTSCKTSAASATFPDPSMNLVKAFFSNSTNTWKKQFQNRIFFARKKNTLVVILALGLAFIVKLSSSAAAMILFYTNSRKN